jgi:hypothetical protein
MAAAVHDLVIEQGVTLNQQFLWTDSTGAVVDLTGYTGRMQIRASYTAATTIADLTVANGGIVIVGATGSVTAHITATATAAMNFVQAVYDLEMVAPDGVTVTRLIQGAVTLSKEVTR